MTAAKSSNTTTLRESNHSIRTLDQALLRTMPLPEPVSRDGMVLIVNLDRAMPGTALLAARAAMRAGCGRVIAAVPHDMVINLALAMPELTVQGIAEHDARQGSRDADPHIADLARQCQAIVLCDKASIELLASVGGTPNTPVISVHDGKADGNEAPFPAGNFDHKIIASSLPASTTGEEGENLEEYARSIADWGATVAVTGACSGVIVTGGEVYLDSIHTPGLASAACQHVLAGAIAGIISQGVETLRGTLWGTHLIAAASELAEKERGNDGIIASDLCTAMAGVLRYLRRTTCSVKDSPMGIRSRG